MSDGWFRLQIARMCLGEVGEDPADVTSDPSGFGLRFAPWVPDRIAWRAATLSRIADSGEVSACFTCGMAARFLDGEEHAAATARCLAYLPLTVDCGVDR